MKALNFLNSLPEPIIPVYIDAGAEIQYTYNSVKKDQIYIYTDRELKFGDFTIEVYFSFYVDYISRHEADCNNHELELKLDRDFVSVKILEILNNKSGEYYTASEAESVLIQDFIAKNICLVAN